MECGYERTDSCATHACIDKGEVKWDGFMKEGHGGGAQAKMFCLVQAACESVELPPASEIHCLL